MGSRDERVFGRFSRGRGRRLRHGVNLAAARLLSLGLTYGILAVNVGDSLVMGLLMGWFAVKADPGQAWRLFLTTGVLGGFTIFSTISLDTALLWERSEAATAALYVLASVAASVGASFLGLALVRQFAREAVA